MKVLKDMKIDLQKLENRLVCKIKILEPDKSTPLAEKVALTPRTAITKNTVGLRIIWSPAQSNKISVASYASLSL